MSEAFDRFTNDVVAPNIPFDQLDTGHPCEIGSIASREADADVAEAIDFLEYYAREAVRLGSPREE